MISTKVPSASCNENKQICEGNFFLKNLFNHLHMFKEIYYKRNRSDYKERCRAKNSFALQMNIKMSSHAQNNLIQNESFATKKNHQRNFIIWNLQRFNIVSYLKYAGPTICFPCSYTIENNLKYRSTRTQWNESPVQEFY